MYGTRTIDAVQSSDSVTDAVLTVVPHTNQATLASAGSLLPVAVAGAIFYIAPGEWAEINRGPYVVVSVDVATDLWTIRKWEGGVFADEASGTITLQVSQGFFDASQQVDFQLEFVSEIGGILAVVDWEGSFDGENWFAIGAQQTAPAVLANPAAPADAIRDSIARYINANVSVIDTSIVIAYSSFRRAAA